MGELIYLWGHRSGALMNDVRHDPRGSLALQAPGGAIRIGPGRIGLKRPPLKSLSPCSPHARVKKRRGQSDAMGDGPAATFTVDRRPCEKPRCRAGGRTKTGQTERRPIRFYFKSGAENVFSEDSCDVLSAHDVKLVQVSPSAARAMAIAGWPRRPQLSIYEV